MKVVRINRIDWDSDFFDKEIYGIYLDGHPSGGDICPSEPDRCLAAEINRIKDKGGELVYVFMPVDDLNASTGLPLLAGMRPADIKIVYSRDIVGDNGPSLSPSVKECRDAELLYPLAYRAGHKSRFRDGRFGQGKFEEMYRIWTDKSVSGEMATNTFVYFSDGTPAGMVTVKVDREEAVIGLIAVYEEYAGRHIGSSLMRHVIALCREAGVRRLSVPTQKDNTVACRFYERLGFKAVSHTAIYHVWL